jgi:hypothetical protein
MSSKMRCMPMAQQQLLLFCIGAGRPASQAYCSCNAVALATVSLGDAILAALWGRANGGIELKMSIGHHALKFEFRSCPVCTELVFTY